MTVAVAAGATSAQAQLVSSWTAPARDDGAPSADPINSWLTDTATGDFLNLPNVFGANALAADNSRGRIYTAGDTSLITFVADPNSSPDGLRELDERIPIRDADGNGIGRPTSMGFARGRIYAFATAGFFAIDPDTGFATSLPFPIEGVRFRGIDYNPDDGLMYAVTGFFPNEEIIAFDLDTFGVTQVAVVPASVYNFSALGSYNFDGVAVGEGKVFLTTGMSDRFGSLRIGVYDIASGEFSTLENPPRLGENRSYPGGATYFTAFGDGTTAACSPADLTTEGTADGVPDGQVTLSDFSFYLTLWASGDAAADLTTEGTANGVPDGQVTLSDFSFYLTSWSAGCP